MTTLVLAFFWTSLALLALTYCVYPAFLCWLAWDIDKGEAEPLLRLMPEAQPRVALIIRTRNEDSLILNRLHAALNQDYPADRLEIIVACDRCEDATEELLESFGDPRVQLRKTTALNRWPELLVDCVRNARAALIVICDARVALDREAIARLSRHFLNPHVGGVSGRCIYPLSESPGFLGRITAQLHESTRRAEARLGFGFEVQPGLYAVRRELIPSEAIQGDIALSIAAAVYRQSQWLIDDSSARAEAEISSRATRPPAVALADLLRAVCSVWTSGHPMPGTAILLHKVLVRLTPIVAGMAVFSNFLMWNSGVAFQAAFVVQASVAMALLIDMAASHCAELHTFSTGLRRTAGRLLSRSDRSVDAGERISRSELPRAH